MADQNNNNAFDLRGLGMDFTGAPAASGTPAQTPAAQTPTAPSPAPALTLRPSAPTQALADLAGLGGRFTAPQAPRNPSPARTFAFGAPTQAPASLAGPGVFGPTQALAATQQAPPTPRSASSPTFDLGAFGPSQGLAAAQQAPPTPRPASTPTFNLGAFGPPQGLAATQQAPPTPRPASSPTFDLGAFGPPQALAATQQPSRTSSPAAGRRTSRFSEIFDGLEQAAQAPTLQAPATVEQYPLSPGPGPAQAPSAAQQAPRASSPDLFADFDSQNDAAFLDQYTRPEQRRRSVGSAQDLAPPGRTAFELPRTFSMGSGDAYLDSILGRVRPMPADTTSTPEQAQAKLQAAIERIRGPPLSPRSRLRWEIERRGLPSRPERAVKYSPYLRIPVFRRKDGRLPRPSSPGLENAKAVNRARGLDRRSDQAMFRPSELPRRPSMLNPDRTESFPPLRPRSPITNSRPSSPTFESPRAVPTPPRRHNVPGAVAFPMLPLPLPEGFTLPATPAELEELTGMDRETGLATAANLLNPQASSDGDYLKTQRALLKFQTEQENLRLQEAGRPLLRNSEKIPEFPEERAAFTRGLLHEYHERFVTMQQQWADRERARQEAEQALKDLSTVTAKHSALEQDMLDVQQELDDTLALQRSEREEHDQELEGLRAKYSRLRDRARTMKEQQDAARLALAEFQRTYQERTDEANALRDRMAVLKARNDELERIGRLTADTFARPEQVPSGPRFEPERGSFGPRRPATAPQARSRQAFAPAQQATPSQQETPPAQQATLPLPQQDTLPPPGAPPSVPVPQGYLDLLARRAAEAAEDDKTLFTTSIPDEPLSEANLAPALELKPFAPLMQSLASKDHENITIYDLMKEIEEAKHNLGETEKRAIAAEQELEGVRIILQSRPSSKGSDGSNNDEFFECEEDLEDAETRELQDKLTKCLLHGQALKDEKESANEELDRLLKALIDSKAATELLTQDITMLENVNQTLKEQLAAKPEPSTSTDANERSPKSSSSSRPSPPQRGSTPESPPEGFAEYEYVPRSGGRRAPPPPPPRSTSPPIPDEADETDDERRRRWNIRIAEARLTPEWIAAYEERRQASLREEAEQAELDEARQEAIDAMNLPEPSDDPISSYHDIADAIRRRERERKFPRGGRR